MGKLSLLIFLPTVAAIPLAFLSRGMAKWVALLGSLATLALSVVVYVAGADPEKAAWIPKFGIEYHLAADGLSRAMLLLTTLLSVVAIFASWNSIHEREKQYYALLLVLETGMLGVFAAFDLFLFYVFWEVTLIPMVFLIGIWGGPRRIYSAVKFLIFTMAGSLFMLAAIIYMALQVGSFDYGAMRTWAVEGEHHWLFLAFTIAFMIKVPLFPFHTWLPDAHVEAPTAGSVILAGVLLKMGGYGLSRFSIEFFPKAAQHFADPIVALAVIGTISGSFMAMTQGDIKRLIAYSSVAHMGFVVLGLFSFTPDAVRGAKLEMISHGLSTGALFFLVGVVYERTHKRGVEDFGGLASVMPRYASVFLIATLSSIGLPGLNGFIGELLILLGAYQRSAWAAAFAATGVILGAIYMLRLYRNMFWGELRHKDHESMGDLNSAEWAGLLPLTLLMILLGILPRLVLDVIK
jgi:NADH-quinone oxidoreductase subunit M